MISVVIATCNHERTLGPVLSGLIAAAIDALVREVIIADAGSIDRTLQIADDAGARILKAASLDQACRAAKSEWLLILDPAAPPPAGWENAALDHIREHDGQAGWWDAGKGRGLTLWLPRRVTGRLLPKRLYEAVALSRKGRRMTFGR
jgi:glycosyltransferase involved in cell wall biosynthesis